MLESKKRCQNCKFESNTIVNSDGFFFCFSCFDKLLEIFGFPEFHRKIKVELSELGFKNLIHSYSIKKATRDDFLPHGLRLRDNRKKGSENLIEKVSPLR